MGAPGKSDETVDPPLLETDICICKNGDVVPESSLRLICRHQIRQMRSAYCQILFFVCGVGRCWWLGECCSSLQQVLNLGCESEAPGRGGGCLIDCRLLGHSAESLVPHIQGTAVLTNSRVMLLLLAQDHSLRTSVGNGRIGCEQSLQTLRHILLVNLGGKSYSPLPY